MWSNLEKQHIKEYIILLITTVITVVSILIIRYCRYVIVRYSLTHINFYRRNSLVKS